MKLSSINSKPKFSNSFSKISQVLHLQSRHLIVLLLRMNFSQQEYANKTLVYNFRSLKLCIFWTTNNWVTIVFFSFIFYQYFPAYSQIYGAVLGIEKTYHRFSVMATSTFLIAELTWLAAFTEHFAGKNKALDLIYELSSSLERDLTSGQQERQIRWFNRAHFFIGWYVKSNYAGILSQMFMIWGIIFRSWYIKGSISLLEVPLYLFLSASSNHLGAFAIVFSTFLINDLFFMIGVFKCKLDRCWRLLRTLLLSNNSINNSHYALHCFDHQYGDLHRQLNMYNCFASKFIYMSNMIVKVAANITFTILLSQGNLASNYIGLVIIFCYIFGYFSLQLVFLILAYFPGQNLLVFKAVSGFSAHQALLTATVNERYNSYPSNRINRSNLKYLLKLNNLTHFLTNNQFGFTYSVFYLVQKWDILDNTFYTFYLLLLFYKRYI